MNMYTLTTSLARLEPLLYLEINFRSVTYTCLIHAALLPLDLHQNLAGFGHMRVSDELDMSVDIFIMPHFLLLIGANSTFIQSSF